VSFPTSKIIDFCFVTDFVANGSFESLRNNVNYLDGDGFAILVRITDYSKKWKGNFKYVSESAYKFLRHSYLIENDLIMSNVGEPGKVFLLPNLGQPMTLGPNSILIRPDKLKAIEKYLYYYFLSNFGKEKIDSITSGTTQKKFNKTSFRNLDIPLPPLGIQQKIVAKLDALFAEIDTATAAAEANANNAEALFQSYLSKIIEKNSENSKVVKLGMICEIARGGSPRPIDKFITDDKDGINWIKIGDATRSKKYIFETREKIIKDGVSRSRLVKDGDFLLSNSMSYGRPYIMRTTGCIHDGWLVLSKYQEFLDIDYFYYLLSSAIVVKQFDNLAQGSTVSNLNKELVSRVEVRLPSLSNQKLIVSKLNLLTDNVDIVKNSYINKIRELSKLKQSILQQAFSGELVKD